MRTSFGAVSCLVGRLTSFGSVSSLVGEEDFFWIRLVFSRKEDFFWIRLVFGRKEDFFWIHLVFSRRGGLLLEPGYPDRFWIYAGITSTRCLLVFIDHLRVNVKGQFRICFVFRRSRNQVLVRQ